MKDRKQWLLNQLVACGHRKFTLEKILITVSKNGHIVFIDKHDSRYELLTLDCVSGDLAGRGFLELEPAIVEMQNKLNKL